MARILAISSHVVHGHVGLCATVPALQQLGHEVWALPTVILASRPGLGRLVRRTLPDQDLSEMLLALENDGCWAALDAVLTGYFPSCASVRAAAHAIKRIQQANAKVRVLVDPIVGDGGQLYVDEETAAAVRDDLLPLAQIATPNLFELTWLTGLLPQDLEEVAGAARQLGPPLVVVTSASLKDDAITTLLATETSWLARSLPWRSSMPNGAGDLFAGLFLGHLLEGLSSEASLGAAHALLEPVLAASSGREVLQLSAMNTRRRCP